MLHEFIRANRDEIITRCRAKVATRSMPPPTAAEIDHGVPVFLDQLVDALAQRAGGSSPEIGRSAVLHGHDLLLQGFTVSQVVHDYGDVCQAVTELAVEMNAPDQHGGLSDAEPLPGRRHRGRRDRVRARAESVHASMARSRAGAERLGFLAHELRNLINTAILAFDVLKTGNVGVSGSTGTVLHRSLMGLRALIGRSLAEVRLTQGVQNREPFLVVRIHRRARAGRHDGGARPGHHLHRHARRGWRGDRGGPAGPRGSGGKPPAERLQVHAAAHHRHAAASAPAPSACSSRSRTNAAGSQAGTSTTCSARSSSAAPTARAWAWAWPSADGAPRRTMAGSTRATCLNGAASSLSTCRGFKFSTSRWFRADDTFGCAPRNYSTR